MTTTHYLDVADYVVIASEILECGEADVLRMLKVANANSAIAAPATHYFNVELFPDFHMKTAALVIACSTTTRFRTGTSDARSFR